MKKIRFAGARSKTVASAGLGAIAVAMCAWWALRPLARESFIKRVESGELSLPPRERAVALDMSAFEAPIWMAPPAPPTITLEAANLPPAPAPTPPPAPPPPPFRLQLISIVREQVEGRPVYRALFYDPDQDQLVLAVEGQTLGIRQVESITATGVSLREGANLRMLALVGDLPAGLAPRAVGGGP